MDSTWLNKSRCGNSLVNDMFICLNSSSSHSKNKVGELMPGSKPYEFRLNDYSLDEQQHAVDETFADFFTSVSTSEVVRAAEPFGFDDSVWKLAKQTGVVSMAVPEARGGDGATVVDLVIVAEHFGAALAPIPLIENVVSARLLSSVDGDAAASALRSALQGLSMTTLALRPIDEKARQLVPAGAVADVAIAIDGEDLVTVSAPIDVRPEPNLGNGPVAWWDLDSTGDRRVVLASGRDAVAAYEEAVRLWKLLTAAALIGSASSAIDLAVDFVRSRKAFGQVIGTFQAVSHALVDSVILIDAGRNLVRKAAWYAEHEPTVERALIPMALVSATRASVKATTVGVHVQGGFGFTLESDMTLHFRRNKGWSLLAGSSVGELHAIAATLPMPAGL
jgi:alkylation response protein AidB-like acyl-CoA dehydrogenase